MARKNDSLVYAESELAICRSLSGEGWEVRSKEGFAVVKEPTATGFKTVYVRVEGEGAVLERTHNGAKARIAAVKHSVALGLITEEAGAKRILVLNPPKAK